MIIKDFNLLKWSKTNPSYQIPYQHTSSKVHISCLYQQCLYETKDLVKSEAVSDCIITDCWTSRNNMSYIAITVHFIDDNFTLKCVLLGCHEFSENHISLNLSNKINGINKSKLCM